jgi:hypothetical protein
VIARCRKRHIDSAACRDPRLERLTRPTILLGLLVLGTLALAAPPALATPPGCNPGPLPGTCCPPNADCAAPVLCELGVCSTAVMPVCTTITKDTTFVGVTYYNCIHVSAYVCDQPTYYGGGTGGPLGDLGCRGYLQTSGLLS